MNYKLYATCDSLVNWQEKSDKCLSQNGALNTIGHNQDIPTHQRKRVKKLELHSIVKGEPGDMQVQFVLINDT